MFILDSSINGLGKGAIGNYKAAETERDRVKTDLEAKKAEKSEADGKSGDSGETETVEGGGQATQVAKQQPAKTKQDPQPEIDALQSKFDELTAMANGMRAEQDKQQGEKQGNVVAANKQQQGLA